MNNKIRLSFIRIPANRLLFAFLALFMAGLSLSGIASQKTLAANLTGKKIQMSNSAASATSVSYNVEFKNITAGNGSLIIEFCSNSPLIGISCTAPSGLNVQTSGALVTGSSGTVTSAGWTYDTTTSPANNVMKLKKNTGSDMAANTTQNFTISGITNYSSTGTFYARIYTYNGTAYGGYTGPLTANLGSVVDSGALALSTVASITISATIQEQLTFCVGTTIASPYTSCPTGGAPSLTLGTGTPKVIGTSGPYTDSSTNVYSYIETNASGGAIINLKAIGSNTACTGLYNPANSNSCDIKGVQDNGGGAANALTSSLSTQYGTFGVLINPVVQSGTNAVGTVALAGTYSNTNYWMGTNVGTSSQAFGDTVLNTSGAAAYQKTSQYTFAAVAGAATPAGVYSNIFGLIATGTY